MDFGKVAGVAVTAQGEVVVQPHVQINSVNEKDRPFMHPLNLYLSPPNDESMILEDFEALGVRRLKILRMIEDAELQNIKRGEETCKYLETRVKKDTDLDEFIQLGTGHGLVSLDSIDKRKRDYMSHFVLRMAYCTSEENRRWLIQQEAELLRCRFLHSRLRRSAESLAWFFAASKLNYQQVSNAEKAELFTALKGSTTFNDITFNTGGGNTSYASRTPEAQVESKTREYPFFKVNFLEALELVKRRDVFIKDGIAYVPDSSIFDVLLNRFKDNLATSLEDLARRMPQLGEENRLLPLFHRLTRLYIGKHCEKSSNLKIDLEDLDKLSHQSYPLCMQHLHATLRKEHHLKHAGRMQYGLFLKGIGLTLDQALTFWRNEFSKAPGIDPVKFDKNYAYNIRHNYGKEGGRKNYTPYSCMKIIMGNEPKAGDAHGCPFRHFDAASLKRLLEKNNVTGVKQREILDKSKDKHFQIACTRYFEVVHNKADHTAEPINHPNQFFSDSAQHYGYVEQTASQENNNNSNKDSTTAANVDLTDEDIAMIIDMPSDSSDKQLAVPPNAPALDSTSSAAPSGDVETIAVATGASVE